MTISHNGKGDLHTQLGEAIDAALFTTDPEQMFDVRTYLSNCSTTGDGAVSFQDAKAQGHWDVILAWIQHPVATPASFPAPRGDERIALIRAMRELESLLRDS